MFYNIKNKKYNGAIAKPLFLYYFSIIFHIFLPVITVPQYLKKPVPFSY